MSDPKWDDFYPATKWHDVGQGVRWRLHKHWGTNVWAGENLKEKDGDRSGCLWDAYLRTDNGYESISLCYPPSVVQHRIYQRGDRQISAVLSYPFPRGVGAEFTYFWEIYPTKGDVARFTDEEEMEQQVVQLLTEGE